MADEVYALDVQIHARRLFNVYGEHCGWKAWNGDPMPTWDQLLERDSPVCGHWYAVAQYALAYND